MSFFQKTSFLFLSLLTPILLRGQWEDNFRDKISHGKIPSWMENRVRLDLAPFEGQGISKASLDKIILANGKGNPFLLVRYEIKEGRVFIRYAEGVESAPRFQIVTNALINLSKCIHLPDADFIISLHDSLSYVGNQREFKGPVLTFAKNKETDFYSVLIPDFEALNGYSKVIQTVNQAGRVYPWRRKISKAIWRGASTGGIITLYNYREMPRIQLVDLSLRYPQFLDARLTDLVQIDENASQKLLDLGFMGNYLSIADHIKYKYQILVDGNTSAYSRAVWELFSNSLIFKHDSPHIQWYYSELVPSEHYVAVKRDFSDLIEKIHWAMNNENVAQQIVSNANAFAKHNLNQEDVMLYFYLVLKNYAALQVDTNYLEKAFTDAYEKGEWGKDENGEGTSGLGSTVENTKEYVSFLEEFLHSHFIETVVDVGSGDWEFSKNVKWGNAKYVGYDVVKSIVERNNKNYANDKITFVHADAVHTDLPKADLLICKEVLQHLPHKDIKDFLSQINKYKYCLITNDVDEDTQTSKNNEIPAAHYRTLDITKPPFNIKNAKRVLSYKTQVELKQVWLIEN